VEATPTQQAKKILITGNPRGNYTTIVQMSTKINEEKVVG